MKRFKKITLGVTMLAVLGGLTACGSQNAQNKSTQKSQQASRPASQSHVTELAERNQSILDDYTRSTQNINSRNVTSSVDANHDMTKATIDIEANGDGHWSMTDPMKYSAKQAKKDLKVYWQKVKKAIPNSEVIKDNPRPVNLYYTQNYKSSEQGTPVMKHRYYLVYKARTNKTSLQDMHMKPVKSANPYES